MEKFKDELEGRIIVKLFIDNKETLVSLTFLKQLLKEEVKNEN